MQEHCQGHGSERGGLLGTPAARRKLDLSARFIVVGVQIFKKDYQYICDNIAHKRVFVVVDEAQMLKNTGSDNYAKVRDFARAADLPAHRHTPVRTARRVRDDQTGEPDHLQDHDS